MEAWMNSAKSGLNERSRFMKCSACSGENTRTFTFHQYELYDVKVTKDVTGTTYTKIYRYNDTIKVNLSEKCLIQSVLSRFFILLPLILFAYLGMLIKYMSSTDVNYIYRVPALIFMPFLFLIPFVLTYFIFIAGCNEWGRALKICKKNGTLITEKTPEKNERYIYKRSIAMSRNP